MSQRTHMGNEYSGDERRKTPTRSGQERRKSDRRVADVPVEVDRRKGPTRSGEDRRQGDRRKS